MSLIDERGVAGPGALDPGPRGLGATAIQGDGYDLQSFGVQLGVQFLPPGQVEAAPSP